MVGDRVERGRLPGSSAAGCLGSSQNICARVPKQNPNSGIVGEDCSQPPDGVDDTMLPCLSMISKCTVSPAAAPSRPTVGSPPPSAPTVGSPAPNAPLGAAFPTCRLPPNPPIEPGCNSWLAAAPISLRRSLL